MQNKKVFSIQKRNSSKQLLPPLPEEDLEHISAAEVNEIMAKYDRESATRIFSGNKALFMKYLLIAFTIFAVAINTVVHLNAQIHRSVFIALVLFLAYLLYPARKNAPKNTNKVPWYDLVLAVVSSASYEADPH